MFADIDAERNVLTAMITSDYACTEILDKAKDTDFTSKSHRDIFNICEGLYLREVKLSYKEIIKEGISLGLTSAEIQEIKSISNSVVDVFNTPYWLEQLKKQSKGRAFKTLLEKYSSLKGENILENIEQASKELFELSLDLENAKTDTAKEFAAHGVDYIMRKVEKFRSGGGDILEGTTTGFKSLDEITLGYKKGDLILLGAKTGVGKTFIATHTCISAIDTHKVLYLNTEMSKEQMASRIGSMLTSTPLIKIRTGSLNNEEISSIKQAYKDFEKKGFYHRQVPDLNLNRLTNIVKKEKKQHDIDLVILDYIGRMNTSSAGEQEWQVLYNIAKHCKILAQMQGVAVMALIQLNDDDSVQGAKKIRNEADLSLKFAPIKNEDELDMIRQMNKKDYREATHKLFIDKARDTATGVFIPLVVDMSRQSVVESPLRNDGWSQVGEFKGIEQDRKGGRK